MLKCNSDKRIRMPPTRALCLQIWAIGGFFTLMGWLFKIFIHNYWDFCLAVKDQRFDNRAAWKNLSGKELWSVSAKVFDPFVYGGILDWNICLWLFKICWENQDEEKWPGLWCHCQFCKTSNSNSPCSKTLIERNVPPSKHPGLFRETQDVIVPLIVILSRFKTSA